MSIVVRAFPVRQSAAEVRDFVAMLQGERKDEVDVFYRQFGVAHESWHLQDTPNGTLLIGVTVVDDVATAAPVYAKSSSQFDQWFKSGIKHLTGVDPNQDPLGPPTTQVFAWSDEGRSSVETASLA